MFGFHTVDGWEGLVLSDKDASRPFDGPRVSRSNQDHCKVSDRTLRVVVPLALVTRVRSFTVCLGGREIEPPDDGWDDRAEGVTIVETERCHAVTMAAKVHRSILAKNRRDRWGRAVNQARPDSGAGILPARQAGFQPDH